MDNFSFSPLAVIFAFTTLNEALIEYLFGSVKTLRSYLPLLALLSAITLSFIYKVNIFVSLLGLNSNIPFLDYTLSGFIISRGSNFVNDFVQKVLGSK